jgi:pyruvate ferredoxin oxidoreductase gamma subunit
MHSADEVRRHTGHPGPIVARDFVALALEQVGSAAAVSVALASLASAMLGFAEGAVAEAVRGELEAIGLSGPAIQANLRLAELARAGVTPGKFPVSSTPSPSTGSVVDVAYAPAVVGAPTVTARPNTPLRKTGNWRVFRPSIDLEKCTQCWICFVRCPEGAIELDAEENPHVDYEVCKGCLICVEECPTGAITKTREVREWAPTGGPRSPGLVADPGR